ncbi:ABC transporter ATP-binding protein [Shinella pollutisoli]|uniref:ABC transporter ATP-binding protein n=1 Tax=Shinella pollutisoli TaxID=2250594 RepID=A0ABV7DHC2_9HYPH|nr:ABC transporter ATP-binding protein [Shinella pollutisoli]
MNDGGGTFRGVTKKFGSFTAVNDLSFEIEAGSFVSIVGPSGCGKTTTLRLIAGFEFPTVGSVFIGGSPVERMEAYERPINMVFQSYALFPHLDVFDNIAYGLRSRRNRRPAAEVKARVNEIIGKMQLSGKEHNRVWELSGGQQQRVALARAIVNNPKILILDEPMAALDKKLRRDVQFELQSLQRELGITFIMVTHDQHEALSLSDRIIVMNRGRIEQIGSPDELYNRPASRFVASFIGDFNLLELEKPAAGGTVDVAGRVLAVPQERAGEGATIAVGFRPDALKLSAAAPGAGGEAWRATITNVIYLGDKVEIKLDCPSSGTLLARADVARLAERRFRVGDTVHLTVEDSDFHHFTK